eukprot:gene505-964_t
MLQKTFGCNNGCTNNESGQNKAIAITQVVIVTTALSKAEGFVSNILLISFGWGVVFYGIVQILEYTTLLRFPGNFTLCPLYKSLKKDAEERNSLQRMLNLVRLLRSQMYCTFAVVTGLFLLITEYHNWPSCLISHWSDKHDIIFKIALSNWFVSLLEEIICGKEVISHMVLFEGEEETLLSVYRGGLVTHHILTIFAYGWCLNTHTLAGLGVFGLIFESPILLTNLHDIFASYEIECNYPFKRFPRLFYRFYVIILVTIWHITRTVPCLLWPLSLIIWRTQLSRIPISSQVVYHFLGLSFLYANMHILLKYISRYTMEDYYRAGFVSKEQLFKALYPTKKYPTSKQSTLNNNKQQDQNSSSLHTNNNHNTNNNIDSNNNTMNIKKSKLLLGYEDISSHTNESDIWIVIHNEVYNITSFINTHPGGKEILIKYAGIDATTEFISIGHSSVARELMEDYHIGSLIPGGYSQSTEPTLKDKDDYFLGNFSEPYRTAAVHEIPEKNYLSGSVLYAKWISAIIFLIALYYISQESSNTLQIQGSSAPNHLYIAKEIEEEYRLFFAQLIANSIIKPIIRCINILAPQGYKFWMYPSFVFDLGSKADYGIAIQISSDTASQQKPEIFQCNVGYLTPEDYLHTSYATYDMMNELVNDTKAGEKGFVADILAVFPLNPDQQEQQQHMGNNYTIRELNLSAWASENAARKWYMDSPAHNRIVKEYYGRDLKSFSSMLASLSPSEDKPIRWDVRCQYCMRVVKGPQAHVCPFCDKEMCSMPYI